MPSLQIPSLRILTQMNTVHGLMTKLHMASIKAPRDAVAVLTEEQQARMDKMHKRMKSHGGKKEHSGDYSKLKNVRKARVPEPRAT